MMRRFVYLLGLAVLLVLVVAACGGSARHRPPYKTTARPRLAPNLAAPNCATGDNHSLGACLPKPKVGVSPKVGAGAIRCEDRSNNNPLFGVANWRRVRASGITCLYVKVNESTGFIDGTAARMAADAKAAGLAVGGYDFQHVCQGSATAEADVFAAHERADGLTGPNTLPGSADVEYPTGASCNARAWESEWRARATHDLGRATITYTGAWYWNPVLGCWWVGGEDWISGYDVSFPALPCGHVALDLWQNTDRGFDGVGTTDLSLFRDGPAAYARFVNRSNPVACGARVKSLPAHCLALFEASRFGQRLTERQAATDYKYRRRAVSLHDQLVFFEKRLWFVAHHRLKRGSWVSRKTADWTTGHRGFRFLRLLRDAQGR